MCVMLSFNSLGGSTRTKMSLLLCALILSTQTLALYKLFTYLLTYLLVCSRLLGLRVVNVYDVDSKTYLIKLAKLVSLVFSQYIRFVAFVVHLQKE